MDNSLNLIDEKINSGIYPINSSAEFDSVIQKLGYNSRIDFLKAFLTGFVERIEHSNKTMNLVNSLDAAHYCIPNLKQIQLNDFEVKGFNNFLETYFKIFLLHVTENADNKHIIEFLNCIKSINRDSQLIYGQEVIKEEVVNYLTEKSKQNKPIESNTQSDQYFIWKRSESELNKLFSKLTNPIEPLIENDYSKFCSLFIVDNIKPIQKLDIKWVGNPFNLRQIAHLFHSLCEKDYIDKFQSRKINKIIADRLLDFQEKSISLENLKKSYSALKTNKVQSQQIQAIDAIVESLLFT